jgi:hypothetical protein
MGEVQLVSPEIPIWRVRWVRGLPLPRGEVDPEPDERRGGEIHGFASTKKVGLMRLVRFITTQKIEVRKILCAKMLGIITVLPFFFRGLLYVCIYIIYWLQLVPDYKRARIPTFRMLN